MTMAYHRHHGLDVRIVRIFNTYGPQMRPDDGRAVSNFMVQALRGEPITIYGDGSQTRSFTYVDDEIRGFLALLDSDVTVPVNIGNPEEYTISQLAELTLADHGIGVARSRTCRCPSTIRPSASPTSPAPASCSDGSPRSASPRVCSAPPSTSARSCEVAMTAGTSPVAGTVVAVAVRDGERVAAGHTLCTVESMKMHHDVVAERPGIVSAVVVTVGAAVVVGDVLVEIDDSDDGTAPGDGDERGGRSVGGRRVASRPRRGRRASSSRARRGTS